MAGAASWGGPASGTTSTAVREYTPSAAGGGSSTEVQYKALVPFQGVSPSVPPPTLAPASSRTCTRCPASVHAAAHRTPTLTRRGLPAGVGDGTSHTARLAACGIVRNRSGRLLASCTAPPDACRGARTLQPCSPTCSGARTCSSTAAPAAAPAASSPAARISSAAATWTGSPPRSHPWGQAACIVRVRRTPAATCSGIGCGRDNAIRWTGNLLPRPRFGFRPVGRQPAPGARLDHSRCAPGLPSSTTNEARVEMGLPGRLTYSSTW